VTKTGDTPEADVLFGRAREQALLGALLDGAGAERGGALIIEGVAGIGKTSLVQWAREQAIARGFDVRLATGVPVETDLPYGALSALTAADQRANGLGDAPALAAAVGQQATGEPPGVMEVSGQLLEWLSSLGRHRPVALILDDAQWADPSSVAVIGHVGRRLLADRIAIIVAQRVGAEGAATSPSLDGLTVVELYPLDHATTVRALLDAGCTHAQAEQWAPRCGGLPLAITEVGRRIDQPVAGGSYDIGDYLPAAYRARIEVLPEDVRQAAVLAALCGDRSVLAKLAGASPALLAIAEREGLVSIDPGADSGGQVIFRHPLLRAAVLATAGPAAERAAHRAIAEVLLATEAVDRAAIHLAAGADGPDTRAADALEQLGVRAYGRGAMAEAAGAWQRAAGLVPQEHRRAPLLARAAEALFDSGDAPQAQLVLQRALDAATDVDGEAAARTFRATIDMWSSSPQQAVADLVDVAETLRDHHPGRAASALAAAARAGHLDGDLPTALRRGLDAEQLARLSGDVTVQATASASLAMISFLAGRWVDSEARADALEPLAMPLLEARSWAGIQLAQLLGTTWVCAERWDDAEPLVRQLLHVTRSMGARLTAAASANLLGALCWRRGRWDEAAALGLPLLDDVDGVPAITLAWIRVQVGLTLASLGRVDQAREAVTLGCSVAAAAQVRFVVAIGEAVLGHLELSLGNNEAALVHLDRVSELTKRMGLVEPEYFLWHGDHFEALVRMGRTEDAAAKLEELTKIAEDGGRRWLRGVVARGHAQLTSDPAEAAACFDDALDYFEGLGMPFEVARTLLVRGRNDDLVDARRIFLQLGGQVWAQACLSGDSPTPESAATNLKLLDRLTPQERAVALAVASGRTNREAAAELHLSVKTIDHYLQRVYRRLGVKNRTQLASEISIALAAPSRNR
jgi:DNA-binding CsgD family transcriptional regulator/tetratricopeptide (TPR) repeat protein